MFWKIWEILKKRNVLEQALLDSIKMVEISKKQFEDAFKSLLENDNELAEKVISNDKELDDLKVKIRERTLGYLIGSSEVDLSYAVLILDAASSLERIGDHCASVAELVISYPKPINREDMYHPIIMDAYEMIHGMFDKTQKAVDRDSDTIAQQMIDKHKNNVRALTDKIIEELNSDTTISTKRAMRLALLSHLFRRISGQLTNISKNVITPIHT